jgi:hypothetical protein
MFSRSVNVGSRSVTDGSRVMLQLVASLVTYCHRLGSSLTIVIDDHNMFIVKAAGLTPENYLLQRH